MMTTEQHAARARAAAKAVGCADCIHYAPNWQRRADALYAAANEAGISAGSPYLLADGRMVVVCDAAEVERRLRLEPGEWSCARDAWFFEPKEK